MLEYISLLTPVYVPLFWFLVLMTNTKNNNSRKFLSIFMFIVSCLYIGHAIYFYKYFNIFTWYDSIYTASSLMVYPMFYVYLRLLSSEVTLSFKHYKHFIPALLLGLILFACTFLMSKQEAAEYFNYYTNSFFYVSKDSSFLIQLKKFTYLASRVIFSLQILYYTIISLRTLKLHSTNIKELYSNVNNKELIWVKSLIVIFSLTSLFSFIVNIIGKELFLEHSELLLIPSIIFSTMIFLIGFLGNMQKQISQEINLDKKNDYIGKDVVEIDKSSLLLKIDNVMTQNKLYLDSDLKIWDVCLMLNIDRITLSKIIHESFNCDFNHFVNKYRIDEAKIILDESKTINLLEVAKKSGFESLPPFIQAYKKIEGISPLVKYPAI